MPEKRFCRDTPGGPRTCWELQGSSRVLGEPQNCKHVPFFLGQLVSFDVAAIHTYYTIEIDICIHIRMYIELHTCTYTVVLIHIYSKNHIILYWKHTYTLYSKISIYKLLFLPAVVASSWPGPR